MSNKIKALTVISAMLVTLSGCITVNNYPESSEIDTSSVESASSGNSETEPRDYETEVNDLTSIGFDLKNTSDSFMTMADTSGAGMRREGDGTFVDISISDGIWNATLSSTSCFKSSGDYYWKKTSGDIKIGSKEDYNYTAKLCIELRKVCPEIKEGHIGIYLQGGKTHELYLTESPDAIPELAACMTDEGWYGDFEWGEHVGVTKDGIVVATCPKFE